MKRKSTKILLFLLLFFCVAIGFDSASYAKATYKVTPKTLAKVAKKKYGAKWSTSNTQHYLGFNLYMKKLSKAGGGTLVVGKGTYKLSNPIQIPSNITIKFQDGVTLKKVMSTGVSYKASSILIAFCPEKDYQKKAVYGKYNCSKNVKLIAEDGAKVVFDLGYNKDVLGLVVAHNNNVEIAGITFKGLNGKHYIELNGTKNASIHDCYFGPNKKSTVAKLYNKEAVNIDLADSKVGGIGVSYVKQDKTPCKNVEVYNNVFDGCGRGLGSHKFSQTSSGKNIYHENITVKGNTFKNNYDNGLFMLNWKNTTITDNKFYHIGNSSKMKTTFTAHGIAGSGLIGITITGNHFEKIGKNPIYFMYKENVIRGAGYKGIKLYITPEETELMVNNTATDCGEPHNEKYAGYEVVYFRNNGKSAKENAVAVDFDNGEVNYDFVTKKK
ncbi:MAG: right-handed parallel beta-helix repeat-containing protein [Lachnospiraceae bacterium]|nr:right-handed parallel beta-helix repeat-containing protein [Lachnospiraceae bacterium]